MSTIIQTSSKINSNNSGILIEENLSAYAQLHSMRCRISIGPFANC